MRFADDHPDLFCFMEKSRLHTVNGLVPDDPPSTTEGYICTFKELAVTAVSLDDLMKSEDGNLKSSELVVEYETKLLKTVKDLMYQKPMNESFEFINKEYPYQSLYKLFAKKGI